MTRAAWLAGAAATLAGAARPAFAPAQDLEGGGWAAPSLWGLWGIWGLVMMLVMLVFWGLVIAGLVVGLRWLLSLARDGRREGPDAALDILRQRYARGEISKEEFEAKKRDLA